MAWVASGGRLRIDPTDGMLRLPTAIAGIPETITKNMHAYHAWLLKQLKAASQRHFYAEIQRPAEHDQGIGGNRKRQTGNFTWGVRGGGAFVGRLMQDGDIASFGWPDVNRADEATNYVWRSLEHGLRGTRVTSSDSQISTGIMVGDYEYSRTLPRGVHNLPRAFHFTTDNPRTSQLKLGYGNTRDPRGHRRKSAGYRREQSLGPLPQKSKYGGGFEGKYFIARAWGEVIYRKRLRTRYKTIIRDSFAKAIK